METVRMTGAFVVGPIVALLAAGRRKFDPAAGRR
jgi:hypothetical protein